MYLNAKHFVISAAVLAAFALAAPAASAAQHHGGGGGGHASAAPRSAPAARPAAPAAAAPRATVAPQTTARPQVVGPVVGHAGPRAVVLGRGSVIIGPRPAFRLVNPYYSFRPRFSLGIGLFVGYPVAFPYWYDPYAYAYSGYGYPAYSYPYDTGADGAYDNSYAAQPQVSYGGLSFDVQPADASVFVDGTYVGVVADFSPTQAPLTMTPGRHHIELRAQGCTPMAFDITVIPGQVIPYQGAMQPLGH